MTIEANKAIIRKYIELWSTGNLALADEVLAADFVDHTRPNQALGPESVKQEIQAFRDGFLDVRIMIEQMIGEGDTVAFRFVLRAPKPKGVPIKAKTDHVQLSQANVAKTPMPTVQPDPSMARSPWTFLQPLSASA